MSFLWYTYYHQKKIKKWNKTKNIRTGACMEWGISQSQETGGGASVGAAPSHLKSPDMHLQSSGNKVGWALGIASQAPRKASANSYRRAGDRNERNFLPLWWRLVPSPPTSTCSRRTKKPFQPESSPWALEILHRSFPWRNPSGRKAGRWRPPPVTERLCFSPSD